VTVFRGGTQRLRRLPAGTSRAIHHTVRALLVTVVVLAFAGPVWAAGDTVTEDAHAEVKASEKRRAKLVKKQKELSARYGKELAEIAKLKRQKSSWRRDRQLKQKLKASLATAKSLGTVNSELSAVDAALAKQRKSLVAAIDDELADVPDAARAKELKTLRAEVAPKVARKKAKKIVLPDDEIDPLADPDELEAQAAALKKSEQELVRQIESLEREAKRFEKQAELREAHARADELESRDDDQPRRTSGSGGGSVTQSEGGEPAPQDSDDGLGDDTGGMFEGDPAVVLSDVERSNDPETKQKAAERARDEVAKRLEKLEKRRKEIEARAKKLRE
jgi:hypothetical protein